MAVPKKRTTKSHQLKRRQNIFLIKPTLVKCLKCGHLILSHTGCPFCGYYKGHEFIDVLAKLDKKERKRREKEMKLKEKEEKEVKKKPLSWKELSRKNL
jgi:large subunit ribosomal protein L32